MKDCFVEWAWVTQWVLPWLTFLALVWIGGSLHRMAEAFNPDSLNEDDDG